MEWVISMNNAMDYIEAHLTAEIDCSEISRIMACPYAVFQRSFAPVTGIQLSEYIRRRRLSRAQEDLQNTTLRIIDIAVKYGYDSSDAFTAAFKRMHGITPQEARKLNTPLKFYPRLTFSFVIEGMEEMNYKLLEKNSFDVLGIRRTTPYGGGTWDIVKSCGILEKLKELCGYPCDLGLCFGFDADGNNDYMCAAEYQGDDAAGFERYNYPPALWLVFTAKGHISEGVLAEVWKRVYGEFLPQSQYRQLDLPTIEKYLLWDEALDLCHVEIMIPVKK
ncbi:MAG: AraC family transcriptional regulator [Clostridiaceae bacterium]|nr:AraC family transcriptional regulator [Clostridiaceae bacterium]